MFLISQIKCFIFFELEANNRVYKVRTKDAEFKAYVGTVLVNKSLELKVHKLTHSYN